MAVCQSNCNRRQRNAALLTKIDPETINHAGFNNTKSTHLFEVNKSELDK